MADVTAGRSGVLAVVFGERVIFTELQHRAQQAHTSQYPAVAHPSAASTPDPHSSLLVSLKHRR